MQGAGHGVDAVHAAHAVSSLDGELGAVPLHALGGAAIHHFFLQVELAPVAAGVRAGVGSEFTGHIGLHGFLVDLDVVLPGAYHGEVGARHGAHAAVGAAVELELELVGEGGTVQFVLVVHGELVAHVLRVVAGIFAAGLAKTGFGRTQVGAGATKVYVHFMGQLVEDFFKLCSLGTKQHDVTGGSVHIGQTRTTHIPNVAQVAQELAVIVLGSGLGHTHGVEVGHAGEHFGLVAVTADNAATIAEHAHDAAVFPVGFQIFVGKLKHTQQVTRATHRNLIVNSSGIFGPIGRFLLDVGHKARPRAAFQLVQQGGCMFRHCHTSTWFVCITQRVMCRQMRRSVLRRKTPFASDVRARTAWGSLTPTGIAPRRIAPIP